MNLTSNPNSKLVMEKTLLFLLIVAITSLATVPLNGQPTQKPTIAKNTVYSLTFGYSSGDAANKNDIDISTTRSERLIEKRFTNTTVVDVIRGLLNQPLTQMRFEGKMPEERLDVMLYATTPMPATTAKLRAVDTLCDAFGLKLNRIVESHKGWKMTCPNPDRLTQTTLPSGKSTMSSSLDSAGKGTFVANGISLQTLAINLGLNLQTGGTGPVLLFDQTGVSGRYDFEIPIDDFATARKVLETKYGLSLEEATQEIAIVVLKATTP